MKNIKLLLATTAMLSMGAMTVNAEYNTGITKSMTVYADFVNNLRLAIDENLSFGTILNPVAGKKVVVSAWGDAPSGDATYTGAAGMPIHPADVVVEGLPAASMPGVVLSSNTIWLEANNGYCGKVVFEQNGGAELTHYENTVSGIKIGGTLTIGAPEGETMATVGNCTGNVTLTLMLYEY